MGAAEPGRGTYDDAMQGWLEPIGPEEPRVYWIRRGIVLVVLLAVVAGVVWSFGRPKAVTATPAPVTPSAASTPSPSTVSPSPTPTPSESPSKTAEPSPSAEPSESSAAEPVEENASVEPTPTESSSSGCPPRSLRLRVEGPATVSQDDASADFHIVVTTTEQSCELDLADSSAALAITSGSDQIWRTSDCPEWHPSGVLELVADEESGFDVSWPVKRARGCELTDEVLGVGTYVATASVGQVSGRLVMQVRY